MRFAKLKATGVYLLGTMARFHSSIAGQKCEAVLEKTEKGGEASFTLEDLRPAKDE
jgi:hypothetical protein